MLEGVPAIVQLCSELSACQGGEVALGGASTYTQCFPALPGNYPALRTSGGRLHASGLLSVEINIAYLSHQTGIFWIISPRAIESVVWKRFTAVLFARCQNSPTVVCCKVSATD